ncbi:Alpha/Beta hydrolase protein [Thelephora terrestris]|uniref:Alpha/Beta hydrolase protein n=1 Tax=Thelephora terrestris TaxID=56493 RepID=A0A9P6H996_9AGAM|nr:Alpha/Beta hydrolase protein [Thelephora terrestris]
MDPSNPESFNHNSITLSTGRKYHYVDQLPNDYTTEKHLTLLLVHGFPDLWYGWRYQIRPWVQAGHRIIAPDMLGYGQSDKPTAIADYTTKKLADDLAALLDAVGVSTVVAIGHDWGSVVVNRFTLWHPDRVIAVAHLSVAFFPRSTEYRSLESVVARNPVGWSYQLYFASEEANEEIGRNIPLFYKTVYHPASPMQGFGLPQNLRDLMNGKAEHKSDGVKSILNDQEMNYLLSQTGGSIQGQLNYYRTTKLRFEEEQAAPNLPFVYKESVPVLYLRGSNDATSPEQVVGVMRKALPWARIVTYEGAGHWLMVETKDEVTRDVLDWLTSFVGHKSKL